MNFKDRIVLITGAGSGLGRQLAEDLAKHGCKIAMGDLNEDEKRLFQTHQEFFRALETTAMTKSYKMVVLLAMLGARQLPGVT